MAASVKLGIIGDFDPGFHPHAATNEAIAHAAEQLSVAGEIHWLPTPSLLGAEAEATLASMDGLWASPGSPYGSMDGALAAIRFARERDWPFVGT
jgi:CTP synthase (UTP-ammonia lyase)